MSLPEDAREADASIYSRFASSDSCFECAISRMIDAAHHIVSTHSRLGHSRVGSSRIVARIASIYPRMTFPYFRYEKIYVRSASIHSRIARPHVRSRRVVSRSLPVYSQHQGAHARIASVYARCQSTHTWKEDIREVKVDTHFGFVDTHSRNAVPHSERSRACMPVARISRRPPGVGRMSWACDLCLRITQ